MGYQKRLDRQIDAYFSEKLWKKEENDFIPFLPLISLYRAIFYEMNNIV